MGHGGNRCSRRSRILVAIRAHKFPEFVLDAVDAVFRYSTTYPHVIVAIDRGHNDDASDQKAIGSLVQKHYPQVGVYCAMRRWGWGAGLYGLLSATVKWAQLNYDFDHFLSLDYDALFIREGADAALVTNAEKENVGLVGTVTTMGKVWARMFKRKWDQVMTITGGREPPAGWEKRAVYGSVMLITKPCLAAMNEAGFFDPPFSDTVDSVKISDDPWLTFLVRLLGFEIADNKRYCYNVWKHPEPPEVIVPQNPELRIFHPAKLAPGGRTYDRTPELRCRNHFRQLRNRKPLE